MRASNEHFPINFPHFPKGRAGRLSFTARIEGAHSDRAASASKKDRLAVPLPPFRGRALREHGRSSGSILLLFHHLSKGVTKAALYCALWEIPVHLSKGSLVDPQTRASNEHIPIVRVPRAGGRPGCPPSLNHQASLYHRNIFHDRWGRGLFSGAMTWHRQSWRCSRKDRRQDS